MAKPRPKSNNSNTSENALTVVYVDPKTLEAASRNARTHSEDQINQLAASIREFGFTNPIIVDEHNVIIAGHGRHDAATEIGLKSVPVIVIAGLSETKKRALALADNRIALNAGWDNELLSLELQDLEKAEDVDLTLLGFGDRELARLLDLGGDDGEDSGPQLDGSLQYRVIVECQSEEHQRETVERLEQEGFTVKPLIS